MVKNSFLVVMLGLLSAGLVALLIYTWVSGYYFNFNVFWNYFSTNAIFANNINFFKSFNQFKNALASFNEFNVLGFNMGTGNSVLKILKIIVNFYAYQINLMAFPIKIILAVVSLAYEIISYGVLLLESLLTGFTNSWTPIGEGGFILPQDWFGSVILVPNVI